VQSFQRRYATRIRSERHRDMTNCARRPVRARTPMLRSIGRGQCQPIARPSRTTIADRLLPEETTGASRIPKSRSSRRETGSTLSTAPRCRRRSSDSLRGVDRSHRTHARCRAFPKLARLGLWATGRPGPSRWSSCARLRADDQTPTTKFWRWISSRATISHRSRCLARTGRGCSNVSRIWMTHIGRRRSISPRGP